MQEGSRAKKNAGSFKVLEESRKVLEFRRMQYDW